jgi:hypothetical protein
MNTSKDASAEVLDDASVDKEDSKDESLDSLA